MGDEIDQVNAVPYLWLGFAAVVLIFLTVISQSYNVWKKITGRFKTDLKIGITKEYSDETIVIDGYPVHYLHWVPLEEGLYLSHSRRFLKMVMPQNALIPWNNFSNIYSKMNKRMGLEFEEYFVDVLDEGKTLMQMQLTAKMLTEILHKNFLKKD